MTGPRTLEEYNALYMKNTRIEGYGTDVTQVFACPFCATPDWASIKIIDAAAEFCKERGCTACGRTAKFIIHEDGLGKTMELVQIGGPAPPDYLGFIRRADN